MDDLTSYATVQIDLYEVGENVTTYEPESFSVRLDNAWDGSLKGLVGFGQGLVLVVIWLWPLLLIIAVGLLIWRYLHKKRRLQHAPKTEIDNGLPKVPEQDEL